MRLESTASLPLPRTSKRLYSDACAALVHDRDHVWHIVARAPYLKMRAAGRR